MTAISSFCHEITFGGLLLLHMLAGATAVLLLAGVAVLLLRSRSAALRHRIWTLSMTALLAMPVLAMLLPDWGPQWLSNTPTFDLGTTSEPPGAESISTVGTGLDSVISDRFATDQPGTRHYAEFSGSRRVSAHRFTTPGPVGGNLRSAGSPPTPHGASLYLWNAVVGIWLAGVVIGLSRFARDRLSASRLVQRAMPVTGSEMIALKEQLRESTGAGLAVPLMCSPQITVPLTVGCVRPVILLPTGYGQWTAERCRVVLAHEMAHIRRQDVLWQLVARLACCLYWCHPLVWLANWRIRVEREFACDDVLLEMGEVPGQYANHLVDVAAALLDRSRPPRCAVAMASRSSLEQRVRAILHPCLERTPVTRHTGRTLAAVSLAVVVALSLMPPSTGQDSNTASSTDHASATVAADKEPIPKSGEKSRSAGKRDVAMGFRDRPKETVDTSDKKSDDSRPADARSATAGKTRGRASRKPAIVSGVVVDLSGRPVPGAGVSAQFGFEQVMRTADREGRFALEIPNERLGGTTLLASGPNVTLGFVQLPWTIDMADAIPLQRIRLESPRLIEVRVVSRQGKPVAEVKVAVVSADVRVIARTTTDKQGRASLAVPKGLLLQFVLAEVAGGGVDYVLFRHPDAPLSDPYKLPQDRSDPIVLTLAPTRSLTVRAVDQNGNAVPGARVVPWYVTLPKKGGDANLGTLWLKQTNDNGIATYDNIPIENEGKLLLWVDKDGFAAKERTVVDPRSSDTEVTATLLPLVPVTGRVVFPDGSPAGGIDVYAAGRGYGIDGYRETTVTADDGAFQFDVDPDNYCIFVAGNKKWASPAETRVVLLGKPIDGIELTLQRATRVFGRLTTGDDNEPMTGKTVQLSQMDAEDQMGYERLPKVQQLPNPTGSRRAIGPTVGRATRTDDAGHFEVFAGPGYFFLSAPLEKENSPVFTVSGQGEIEINLHAKRDVEGKLQGRVVLQSNPNQGVAEVHVFGYADGRSGGGVQFRAISNATGSFEARRSRSAQLVRALSEDSKMGAIVRAEANAESIVLAIRSTAILRGTLVDEETGHPEANREIGASIRIDLGNRRSTRVFRRHDTTDDAGRFEITGVVPGHLYHLGVVVERDNDGRARSWRRVGEVKPTRAGAIELGELRLPRPYHPPTIEGYIARAFKAEEDVSRRLSRKLADAALAYQQVLIVAADPKSHAIRQFFEARYDYAESNKGVREAFANFLILGVNTDHAAFLKDLGVASPDSGHPTVAILDSDGRLVVEAQLDDLANDDKLDRARLTEFLNTRRPPLADAEKELSLALATASREDKRVLVQVCGPGCAACILLSRYLNSQKDVISKDYVYVKLDSRMPNANKVIRKLRTTLDEGIPWMAILSANGKVLVTSDSDEGNIGYPRTKLEKAHFEHMLRTTGQRLSDRDISALLAGLEE